MTRTMRKHLQPAKPCLFVSQTAGETKERKEVEKIAERICDGLALPDLVSALQKTKEGRTKSKIVEEFVQLLLTASPTPSMATTQPKRAVARHRRVESHCAQKQKKWDNKRNTLRSRLKGATRMHANGIITYLDNQRSVHADRCEFEWEKDIKGIGGPKLDNIAHYGQKIDVYCSKYRGILVEVERGGVLANNHDLKDIWKCHLSGARHLILVVPICNYAEDNEPRDWPFEECKKRLEPFFSNSKKHLDMESVLLVPYACHEQDR